MQYWTVEAPFAFNFGHSVLNPDDPAPNEIPPTEVSDEQRNGIEENVMRLLHPRRAPFQRKADEQNRFSSGRESNSDSLLMQENPILKVNVGMSRKLSKDYNSTGFSVNLEGESAIGPAVQQMFLHSLWRKPNVF